jgi:hypothetical protein
MPHDQAGGLLVVKDLTQWADIRVIDPEFDLEAFVHLNERHYPSYLQYDLCVSSRHMGCARASSLSSA